jgi:hypothetical protein
MPLAYHIAYSHSDSAVAYLSVAVRAYANAMQKKPEVNHLKRPIRIPEALI